MKPEGKVLLLDMQARLLLALQTETKKSPAMQFKHGSLPPGAPGQPPRDRSHLQGVRSKISQSAHTIYVKGQHCIHKLPNKARKRPLCLRIPLLLPGHTLPAARPLLPGHTLPTARPAIGILPGHTLPTARPAIGLTIREGLSRVRGEGEPPKQALHRHVIVLVDP